MTSSKVFKMKNLFINTQNQAKPYIPENPKSKIRTKKYEKNHSNPMINTSKKKPYRKQKISAALREQVWVQHNGHVFQAKCKVTWCQNEITVFNFQCGHDIPESKGGPTNITNLYPICGKCNLSMSNTYTFTEWCKLYEAKPPQNTVEENLNPIPNPKKSFWKRLFCCFR